MEWARIIQDERFYGGDLLFVDSDQFTMRGPISKIWIDERTSIVYVETKWIAMLDIFENAWVLCPTIDPRTGREGNGQVCTVDSSRFTPTMKERPTPIVILKPSMWIVPRGTGRPLKYEDLLIVTE